MSITVRDILTPKPGATIINAGAHAGKREILGAIRYKPSDVLAADHLALPIAHESTVILYAENGHDDALVKIAQKMRADGFTDVRVYSGTLAEYEKSGGATQQPSTEQIVPPSTIALSER